MYMRAEARRAAESVGVAIPGGARRRHARRMQLASLAVLWLLIAGATMWVGLRWERAKPAVAASTETPAPTPASTAVPNPTPAAAAATPAPIVLERTADTSVVAERPAVQPDPVARPAQPRPAPRTAAVAATTGTTRPAAARARRTTVAPARLVISTTPAGAFVTVDGIGWGQTPARIGYLPPGTKRVRVTKAGYASQERTITVGEQTATLNIALRPLAASAAD
jgi:hypothetical protein